MKDLKIVIVAPQLPVAYRNGGIGTFTDNFIDLLLREGYHNITLIYSSHHEQPKSRWQPFYGDRGITVHSVYEDYESWLEMWSGHHLLLHISETVDRFIPDDADIVYFADFRANGFVPVQRRRYQPHQHRPVMVTVIHGPTPWHRQGQQKWPESAYDLAVDYMERYVPQHSDFVAAPSHYTLHWAEQNGWWLPERRAVLGYPWMIPTPEQPAAPPAPTFKRVIFFGRMETRKGFDLFVKALVQLKGQRCLQSLDEIVFLGQKGIHIYGDESHAADYLQRELGLPVVIHNEWHTYEAQAYLKSHVADSLVVTPSRADTFGFVVIEASLIPGLNLIFSSGGGMQEVLGKAGQRQMFHPNVEALAERMSEWLEHGPRPASELAQYDWQAANQRWLDFHEQVCRYALEQRQTVISLPTRPAVDVCVSGTELGAYLPYALESLAAQTRDDFRVYVVDGGSKTSESRAVFQQMQAQYTGPRWHFIQEETGGPPLARNLAALFGDAPWLIFMSADQVALPHMVERYTEAISHSGDDCLSAWCFEFESPHSAFVGGKRAHVPYPPRSIYMPVGNAPELGLFTNSFGKGCYIIRREVFEALEGFGETYNPFGEVADQEMLTRLSLKGYMLDVVPEFLFLCRSWGLNREAPPLTPDSPLLQAYRERLREVGLEHVLPITAHHTSGMKTHYTSEDGQISFASQLDYLTNGVPWSALLKAMQHKLTKRLRKVAR